MNLGDVLRYVEEVRKFHHEFVDNYGLSASL